MTLHQLQKPGNIMKVLSHGNAYAAATFRGIPRIGTKCRVSFHLISLCVLVMSFSGCERTAPKDTKGKFPEDSVRKFVELVQAKDYPSAERLWYGPSQRMEFTIKFEDYCANFMNVDLNTASISKARKGKSGFWMVNIDWTEGDEKKHNSFGLKVIDGEWKMERGYKW
jgi:hypothetical protein